MSESGKCRVGVAQIDITPSLGSNLGGYFHARRAKEARGKLYTRTMVIENGGKRIALVANDLLYITDEISTKAKEKISSSCGLSPEEVMITATHTHTGPALMTIPGLPYDHDPVYVGELIEKIVECVSKACGSMFDAEIYFGKTEAEGFSISKLCRMKNGKDIYDIRPMDGGKDGRIGFSAPLDNSVQVLCVRDKDKKARAFAINYACHPNSGPDYIWAEWPGEMAETISLIYGQDVPCLFLQGTAGDVDCMYKLPHDQIGRGIAGAAIMAAERELTPLSALPVDSRLRYVPVPRLSKTPETDRIMNELRKKPDLSLPEKNWLTRYDLWNPEPKEINIPIHCMRIGNTALVGMPWEVFTPIGLEIKRYSPATSTMVVELANTRCGYLPPIEQSLRGGYGEWPFITRLFVPEAATMAADTAIEMLWEMWDSAR
jgi:hypothetical protein